MPVRSQRTLLAIGPMPPPVNGMSMAFDMLVQNLPSYQWTVRTVDIADRAPLRVGSAFSFARAWQIVRVLGRAVLQIPQADVVYVTVAQSRWGFAKDVVVLNACAAIGRPTVAHMHGGNFAGFYRSLSSVEQRLVRFTLDRLSRIVVLTDGLKQEFWMTRDWPARTVPISNACDVAPGEPRRLQPGALRVLYLSNLLVAKGYREVVLAVTELAHRRSDLRLHLDVAGALTPGGDFADEVAQRNDLEFLFGKLPTSVTATYHGPVVGMHKQQLLRDADVFALPTWYVNEGQPIAVLEALASGLPVIATDWRGIRESMPPRMLPLLVPPRAPGPIAARLASLLDDPQAFAAMSQAALEKAETFRRDRHVASLDIVLRRALAGEAAGGMPQSATSDRGATTTSVRYPPERRERSPAPAQPT